MKKQKVKKEDLEKLEREKEIELEKVKAALKFTNIIEEDVPVPSGTFKIVNGYSYKAFSISVEKSCSSSIGHCMWGWDKTSSYGTIRQFSTRLLALKALRNAVELKSAQNLRKIDIMIEKELEENKKESEI